MKEITPEELTKLFIQNSESSEIKSEDKTVETILSVFQNYGEYLFSSVKNVKPKCTLRKDIFFRDDVFEQLIKLLRKHKQRKLLFNQFMYFKPKNESLFEKHLLHHEKVNTKDSNVRIYPNDLSEVLFHFVLTKRIELNDLDESKTLRDWEKYQKDAKDYREKLMSNENLLMICSSLNEPFKRLLLSQLNREELNYAWVGCNEFVYKSLIASLRKPTLSLYLEDYDYACNEYLKEKKLSSEYLKYSEAFIKKVEDIFEMKSFTGQPEIFNDEIDLVKIDLKQSLDKNENESQEVFLLESIENNVVDESLLNKLNLDALKEDNQELILILLSYFFVSFRVKNMHIMREMNHLYKLHENCKEETLLEFKSEKVAYLLKLKYKHFKQLYKKLLGLHGIEK